MIVVEAHGVNQSAGRTARVGVKRSASPAFTLLETLFALTLLSLLAIAGAGWIATASAAAARADALAGQRAAIEAFFTLLHDDLTCGEFPRAADDPSVIVGQDQLTIALAPPRSDGFTPHHMYRLIAGAQGRLVLDQGHAPGATPSPPRPLLHGIKRFDAFHDTDLHRLDIRLLDAQSASHHRSFRTP